jgi:GNAT superfamily N-acetyltransferase
MTTHTVSEDEYLASVAACLKDVFKSDRYQVEYLRWLYRQAPEGHEIATDLFEDGACRAHYCVVPQTYQRSGNELLMSLSLNTAVSPQVRRKGVFVNLANDCYEQARARGVTAVVGVANANSTHGFVNRLGFRLVRQLPVVVGITAPLARGQPAIDPSAHTQGELERFAAGLDFSPGAHWGQKWSAAKLAWRLKSPVGRYRFHVGADGGVVSTSTRIGGVPIAIVLKIFRTAEGVVRTGRLLSVACASHKTALYLYCGVNERIRVPGIPMPRRLLPAPLNFIYLRLGDPAPPDREFALGTFEFLDFDAY